MAKGRVSSADAVLAAMVKDYRRLRRSLTESAGEDPELRQLQERRKALAKEMKDLRARIAALRKSPRRKLAAGEDRALTALRDSILAMSRNLGIAVDIE